MLRTRAPLSWKASSPIPSDLHVLGLPLAFILSQDQTLHCINCFSLLFYIRKVNVCYRAWFNSNTLSNSYSLIFGYSFLSKNGYILKPLTPRLAAPVSVFNNHFRTLFAFQFLPSVKSGCKSNTFFLSTKNIFKNIFFFSTPSLKNFPLINLIS